MMIRWLICNLLRIWISSMSVHFDWLLFHLNLNLCECEWATKERQRETKTKISWFKNTLVAWMQHRNKQEKINKCARALHVFTSHPPTTTTTTTWTTNATLQQTLKWLRFRCLLISNTHKYSVFGVCLLLLLAPSHCLSLVFLTTETSLNEW